MKNFSVTGVILIVLLLVSGVTFAQSLAQEDYDNGVESAVQGEFLKAKEEFEKALMVDSLFRPAEIGLKVINNVIEEKIKREYVILLFKGVSHAYKGEYDQAIQDLNKAIEINPKYAEAYSNRGYTYNKKGEYDQAIQDFNKAIEINPKNADAYYNRGFIYDDKGEYDQAIQDFNKAIEINPKNAKAYLNRGIAYYKKGEYDQAIQDFNKAIEINPKHAKAYYNRGVIYADKGEYDQALSDYTKAIEINPKYAGAYNNRGLLYLVNLGNKDKGCADWQKACELGNCKNYNLAKQKGDCQ